MKLEEWVPKLRKLEPKDFCAGVYSNIHGQRCVSGWISHLPE